MWVALGKDGSPTILCSLTDFLYSLVSEPLVDATIALNRFLLVLTGN